MLETSHEPLERLAVSRLRTLCENVERGDHHGEAEAARLRPICGPR
jgi:hypothetical protein